MNKGKYAFWLVPSGEEYNLLKETIRHYSEMYSTPLFEPHITLISSLQGSVRGLRQKASQLARNIGRLELRLEKPAHSTSYFRCVFLDVARAPAIVRAHAVASDLFDVSPHTEYKPHLSLVYGNLPIIDRGRIVSEIGDKLCGPVTVKQMSFYQASSDSPPDTWEQICSCYLHE
ncbi:MAG: 2'-5' RNA ligase family protein [Smithella sp.]